MKGYLKEIIISLAAVLMMLLAITAYFKAVREEKANNRVDIYTLVPPNAQTLLAINRPAIFNRMILNNPALHKIFAAEIPEIFLSLIRENQQTPLVLFSFHPQGVICYIQVGVKAEDEITKDILPAIFRPYSPQKQTENGVDFYYYPDRDNRFFGYYVSKGIWAGSYSRRLLERAAVQQSNGELLLPAGMNSLRMAFDANAPVNMICRGGELGVSNLEWLATDLFVSEGKICCYGGLPYDAVSDIPYRLIGDAFARRIEEKFPGLQLSFQISREGEYIFLTGCYQM